MTTDVESAFTLWGVCSLPILLVGALWIYDASNDTEVLEKQAISAGYATYTTGGSFRWNYETEQENLLKDLEFLKRLEKNREKMPVPGEIIPLPQTKDLFN